MILEDLSIYVYFSIWLVYFVALSLLFSCFFNFVEAICVAFFTATPFAVLFLLLLFIIVRLYDGGKL